MKKIYFFLGLICVLSTPVFAQQDDATDDVIKTSTSPGNVFGSAPLSRCPVCGRYHSPHCTPPPTPTPVPFDGGLSLLLIAGAGYGIKRIKGSKGK